MIASQYLGEVVLGVFVVGIVAAAFSSADSALTALTTSFCVDILEMKTANNNSDLEKQNIHTRRLVHIGISTVFVIIILIIDAIGSDSIITAIYKLASYTYGPLLGLYVFWTLYTIKNLWISTFLNVAVLAPILCFAFEVAMKKLAGYTVWL